MTEPSGSSPQTGVFVDAAGTLFKPSAMNPGQWHLAEECDQLLDAFRRREIAGRSIRTGIITNWGQQITEIVTQLGLSDLFDSLCYVTDSHLQKPDPAFFQLAAVEAGVELKNSFHIGDSLAGDAFGARNSGMTGVWLSPPRIKPSFEPRVSSLNEYLEFLSSQFRT